MKRIGLILLSLAVVAGMSFANGGKESTSSAGATKVIGYYKDAADVFYKDGFEVFKALAEKKGWQVLDVTGQGTAPEQVAAVQNFITQKVDAIVVVQNSPDTSAKTEQMCYEAGIPEFNLTHNPPDNPGLAGFSGYDWVLDGKMAGENAMKHNVKRVIMIEGKLGQGTAAGQTQGFLEAYRTPERTSATCCRALVRAEPAARI
jgi:ABC-type sugar transport system substrate-binding protein